QDIAPLLAMGEEVLAAGDVERALSIFSQIAEMAPDNAEAMGGQARALVVAGRIDEADAQLADLPEALAKNAAIARARAAIALARSATPGVDVAPLKARIEADPDDHEARFELASAYMASGERDAAADAL